MEELQLRCPNRMHGIVKVSENLLEVKCNHWRCKRRIKNMVVLHYYDLSTGKLVNTKEYKDPVKRDAVQARNKTDGKVRNVNSVA